MSALEVFDDKEKKVILDKLKEIIGGEAVLLWQYTNYKAPDVWHPFAGLFKRVLEKGEDPLFTFWEKVDGDEYKFTEVYVLGSWGKPILITLSNWYHEDGTRDYDKSEAIAYVG